MQPEDVTSLLSIKLALKFAQLRDVESMRAIALAHQHRNLAEFEAALRDYKQGASPIFVNCTRLNEFLNFGNLIGRWRVHFAGSAWSSASCALGRMVWIP